MKFKPGVVTVFFIYFILLEFNCFTMLSWFLLSSKVNQLHVYDKPSIQTQSQRHWTGPSRKHLNWKFTCGKMNSFFFSFYFLLKYSGFTVFLVISKVIQLYIYPYSYSFSDTFALQVIARCQVLPLGYPEGPCRLSILQAIVCICSSQIPNLSLPLKVASSTSTQTEDCVSFSQKLADISGTCMKMTGAPLLQGLGLCSLSARSLFNFWSES